MLLAGRILVAVILVLGTWPPTVGAQAACSIAPEFEAIVAALGAQRVGACAEEAWTSVGVTELDVGGQHVKVADGALGQLTGGGLLVRDPGDGTAHFFGKDTTWAARTADGQMQRRAVPGADASAVTAPPPAAPARAPATAVADEDEDEPPARSRRSRLTPALSVRCSNLGNDIIANEGPMIGAAAVDGGRAATSMCRRAGQDYGALGVECFEAAHRRFTQTAGRMPPGSGRIAVDAMRADYDLCVEDAGE